MHPPLLLLCSLLLPVTVNALHFYLDANEKRCFIEELPTDTVVEGTFNVNFHVHANQSKDIAVMQDTTGRSNGVNNNKHIPKIPI
jgi:hypothetical protein